MSDRRILIRKDILFLTIVVVLLTAFVYIVIYLISWHSSVYNHQISRSGKITVLGVGLIFFYIYLFYNYITYPFKYLEFTSTGIKDKMSILFPEFMAYKKIKNIIIYNKTIEIHLSSINIKKFEGLKLTRKKIKQIERILSKQNNLNVTYGEPLEQLTER